MQNLRTIILAAGKGIRMKSDIPKVLHTICGRPIIQYVLDAAKAAGSSKTYIVLGHQAQAVQDHVGKEVIAVQQKRLLGTADAIKCVEKYLKGYRGNVLILCGDTPVLKKATVKDLIRRHQRTNAVGTLLTAVVHNPQGYGRIIRDEAGAVKSIREDKDAVGYEKDIAEINAGVYCFRASELFQALKEVKINKKKKEFYLTDVIELFSEKGLKVGTMETEDPKEVLGINTREDLALAESILRQRTLKEFMSQGITIVDPATTFIDASVRIGKDTVIRPFTFIENNVRIGSRCTIGPFARLRPGTKVGNNVEIGNFTEVSRTRIGPRSLLKHFSYLGDARIGSHVNIGAGTITANFDGHRKNVTRIADNAFIGSDSVLVAPVKIGKRAVVGAGSVVTRGKNVAAGSVVAGVPARVLPKGKKQ